MQNLKCQIFVLDKWRPITNFLKKRVNNMAKSRGPHLSSKSFNQIPHFPPAPPARSGPLPRPFRASTPSLARPLFLPLLALGFRSFEKSIIAGWESGFSPLLFAVREGPAPPPSSISVLIFRPFSFSDHSFFSFFPSSHVVSWQHEKAGKREKRRRKEKEKEKERKDFV